MIKIDETDLFLMSIANYFMSEEGYNPVVIHGIEDEIWLENMQHYYKIIRLVPKYIHNDVQLEYNENISRKIIKKIKLKTFSLNMNVFNIYFNLGDNVNLINDDTKFYRVNVNKEKDLMKKELLDIYPNIVNKKVYKEKGIDLFMKVTEDVSKTSNNNIKKLDKIFSPKKPIITYAFILICLVMIILTKGSNNSYTLLKWGANNYDFVTSGEYYRLISSIFLHAGILHFIFNMYALYIIGPQIESFYGKFKYFLIFILSGISGSILSICFNQNVVSVGASGAIFGLMGSMLYFGYFYRNYLSTVIKSQIIPIIALNLAIGLMSSGIDNFAHIGGLIGGVLTSMAVGVSDKNSKFDKINNILILVIYFAFLGYLCFFK